MVSVPELQSEALKWQRRISMVSGAGLDPAPLTELAKTDLQRIIQGGSPLPEDQIISMAHSAYTGDVATPPADTKPNFNPLHIIGNIGKDITTDIRSAIPGLVHTGADIMNPKKLAQASEGLGKALSDLGSSPHQAAEDIRATPILGGLVPGTFAMTGGWKGFTEHPLNMALDVFPYVSAGSKLATVGVAEAEAGTAMAALKQGHPLQAVARASGLEAKLTQAMSEGRFGSAAEQYLHMPVWRAYNELTRVYSRRLVAEELQVLRDKGLIGRNLSLEESQKLVIDATSYNTRLETQAVQMTPELAQQIKAAGNDAQAAFQNIPAGLDIQAWTVGPDPSLGPNLDTRPVYFTPRDAAAQLPEGANPADFVHEVRVNPHEIRITEGVATARNVLENRAYSPEYAQRLRDIRDWVTKKEKLPTATRKNLITGESIKAPKAYVNNPFTGKTEVFPRSSKVFREQERFQARQQEVTAIERKVAANDAKIAAIQNQAAGRTIQYARYGESAADAAKRPATIPSLTEMYNAAQDFVLRGMYGKDRALYERLDRAFQSGKAMDVRAALTAIQRKVPAGSPEATYARYLRDQTASIGARSAKAEGAVRALARAQAEGRNLQSELATAERVADQARNGFYTELSAAPPERMYPLISQEVRSRIVQAETTKMLDGAKVRVTTQGSGVAEALGQLHEEYTRLVGKVTDAHSREELAAIVGPETLKRVEDQAMADWTQMIKAGYDPIWLHDVNPAHYYNQTFGEIRPLPTREFKPGAFKNRVFNYDAKVLDIQAVLTNQAAEYLQHEATRQYIDFLVNKSGVIHKQQVLEEDLAARGLSPTEIKAEITNKMVPFDPHAYVPTWSQTGDTYFIDRNVYRGFEKLMDGNKMPFKAILDPVHRVFKVSVLTGPRHMVHVAGGGLVMMELQDPAAAITLLTRSKDVFEMARNGTIPEDLRGMVDPAVIKEQLTKGNYEERIDTMMSFTDRVMEHRRGHALGRWWRESKAREGLVNAEQNINNLENLITDMYRSATYLHQMKNGASNEQALAMVNKTFIDVDNLTPFERVTLRQVFPFWTFTKHILRYVLSYPADHPLRASILANLANQIESDNHSGDPSRLAKLFLLGTPDETGKVNTVDFSNLNPFRSTASMFSMAGFLMGAAPELQAGARMFGINPLTGTPSLHQNFRYDSYTGTSQATRPPLNVFDFASAFIPQVNLIDHYLLFTDTMRSLKKNSPEAYHRSLYQEMNLPFALAPINIYDIRAKAAAAQFREAQQTVSDAMKTGNTAPIRQYETVPFEGQLYDANQVANYIDNFDKLFPGIAPRAVMTPPKRRKKKAL